MHQEKQIEEMADILCEAKEHDCKGGNDCLCVKQAEAIYNAGYRKQSEGKWLFKQTYYEADECNCSVCGQLMTTATGTRANFCPTCGAKMQGIVFDKKTKFGYVERIDNSYNRGYEQAVKDLAEKLKAVFPSIAEAITYFENEITGGGQK